MNPYMITLPPVKENPTSKYLMYQLPQQAYQQIYFLGAEQQKTKEPIAITYTGQMIIHQFDNILFDPTLLETLKTEGSIIASNGEEILTDDLVFKGKMFVSVAITFSQANTEYIKVEVTTLEINERYENLLVPEAKPFSWKIKRSLLDEGEAQFQVTNAQLN